MRNESRARGGPSKLLFLGVKNSRQAGIQGTGGTFPSTGRVGKIRFPIPSQKFRSSIHDAAWSSLPVRYLVSTATSRYCATSVTDLPKWVPVYWAQQDINAIPV